MKGFLQRVAASAIRTAPRTHALVEPIYAAPPAVAQAAPSLHFDSVVQPVSPRPRTSEASTIGLNVDREQRGSESPYRSDRVASTGVGASRNIFEPLVQPAGGKSMASSTPAEKPLSAMEGSSEFPLQTPLAGSLERSGTGEQGESRSRGLEYLPGVVERLLKADNSDALESASAHQKTEARGMQAEQPRKDPEFRTIAAQANARRQQHAPASQPSRPSPSQPEEIQIHIGRIEVLAVPQTTPRPAAAPAHRGLNLDDYLSRRNGRNG